MKWLWVCLLMMMQTGTGIASGGDFIPGSRAAAMGRTAVACPGIWSGATNQAGLAWQEGWQTGFFAENRFLLKEMGYGALTLSWSGQPGAFGMILLYHGCQQYNELKAGVSYARKFGKWFSFGIQLHYFRFQITEGYGSRGVVSCEIGWMVKPNRSWTVGMQVCNPVPIKLTQYPEERLSTVFRIGVGYDLAGKVLVLLEVEKDLEHPLVMRTGLEIRLAKGFCARIGMHSGPFTLTGGAGLSLGRLSVDIATEYHMVLGFSPGISVGYTFKKTLTTECTEKTRRPQRKRKSTTYE